MFTFTATVTIIPFMSDGWAPSAGGFPAMIGNVALLMKDVVLIALCFYLLKEDASRLTSAESIDALSADADNGARTSLIRVNKWALHGGGKRSAVTMLAPILSQLDTRQPPLLLAGCLTGKLSINIQTSKSEESFYE